MPSEWDGFLSAQDEVVKRMRSSTYPDPDVQDQLGYAANLLEESLVKLRAKLLPLLEAADAMYYDEYGDMKATIGPFSEWWAARAAALKGSEHASS